MRVLAFFYLPLRNESLDCLLQPHKGLLITFKNEASGKGCRIIDGRAYERLRKRFKTSQERQII